MRTFHIILAFCVGLLTGYLFFDNNCVEPIKEPPADNVLAKAQHIDTIRASADDGLEKRSDLLAGQLLIVNYQLKESKATLYAQRQKIRLMQLQLSKDSIGNCDTILTQNVAAQMDTLNNVTDSLLCDYENKIQLSENMIAVRDSQLVVCSTAYRGMQALVQAQAARERQLTEDLNTALKQQRRRRIQNRVLAAGMLFVSGFTTSLIIKSKQ
jgi:hypothetical protein